MSILPKATTDSMQSLLKFQQLFLAEMGKSILKIMELQEGSNSQTILKQEYKAEGIRPPNFKIYYKATKHYGTGIRIAI